jgi:prephenate dehydrogenase
MSRVGIIGAGLIGGSILKAGLRNWSDDELAVYDKNHEIKQDIENIGAIWKEDIESLCIWADIVFICVPFSQFEPTLKEINSAIPLRIQEQKLVISDVTSPKSDIVALFDGFDNIFNHTEIVFGHPMAGTEYSGFRASFEDLFIDKTWVLLPDHNPHPEAFLQIMERVILIGARVCVLPVIQHDEIVTKISHMPYMLAAVAGILVADAEHPKLAYRLSAGSFADVTRVTGSAVELSVSMFYGNAAFAVPAIEKILKTVNRFKQATIDNSEKDLAELFFHAKEGRSAYLETKDSAPAISETVALDKVILTCHEISVAGGIVHGVKRSFGGVELSYEPNQAS